MKIIRITILIIIIILLGFACSRSPVKVLDSEFQEEIYEGPNSLEYKPDSTYLILEIKTPKIKFNTSNFFLATSTGLQIPSLGAQWYPFPEIGAIEFVEKREFSGKIYFAVPWKERQNIIGLQYKNKLPISFSFLQIDDIFKTLSVHRVLITSDPNSMMYEVGFTLPANQDSLDITMIEIQGKLSDMVDQENLSFSEIRPIIKYAELHTTDDQVLPCSIRKILQLKNSDHNVKILTIARMPQEGNLPQIVIEGKALSLENADIKRLPAYNDSLGRPEPFFINWDIPPAPVGGTPAIMKNLEYVKNSIKKSQIFFILSFYVDLNGDIKYPKITHSTNPELNEAVIAALKSVKWNPGIINNKRTAGWTSHRIYLRK